MIVVATKLDATTNRDASGRAARVSPPNAAWNFTPISSASGEGIVELVRAMANALDRIPKPACRVESQESREGECHDACLVSATLT